MPISLVEALAETKTVEKRIGKKREFVLAYLLRQEKFKDPLEKEGGSVSAIQRELQAIHDLEERKIAIRREIQKVNATNSITVGGETRSIADWLAWRREVAPGIQKFQQDVRQRIEAHRQQAMRAGAAVTSGGEAKPDDIIVNMSESTLAAQIERLEETLGTLDGLLSLKNATLILDL